MTLFLIHFFCLITYISAMDSCHKPIPIQKCGTRRLDPNNEFCCNNQAYSQSSKQCCCIDSISGKQDVYAQDRICCGGQLFNKTGRLGERTCCGAQVHNESDPRQLCCRPHQHQIDKYNTQPQLYHYNPDLYPNWDTSECCGIDVFDNSTQKCCNNNINNIIGSPSDWFCCNKTVYNQRSHQCLKDDPNNHIITLLYHELCNGAPYDQRTNTCCDGQLHPYHDVSQFQCCGTEIQNKETQQCCNKTLSLVISNSRLCCGNRSTGIDSFTQRCCTNPSDPTTNLVHTITTKAQECCGNGLFHNDTQFCCRGQPYLRSRYKRCGNQKECVVVSHQEKCCGVHQLDTSHTCCGKGLLVAKTSSAQDDCCYNSWTRSGKSFVSETHQCVRGKVEVKAKRCGNEIYDDTSDLCCNNILFRGAKEIGKKCCGYEVYHNRTQQCCSFEVVNGTKCPIPRRRPSKICHNLCAKNRRLIAEKINRGEYDSDICKLKLAYVAKVIRQVAYFEEERMKFVIHRPSKNMFTGRREVRHRYLLLPCVCKKKNFSRVIVVTSNPGDKTKELNRFERDIVLPYSKRIKRAVKRRRKNCYMLRRSW